ncbi:heparinase II/III family protein [uncultured Flavobacterium sp.]|uniref:heparinase II/III family protein n=1 Tax=uncultured Flavobacterium sp. TaxID=165435 RepID=UPI0025D5286F|nr:heparinase II/III family protein [uncultured Flavobacterium sp.]
MSASRIISVLSRELKFFYAQRLASFGFGAAKKHCRQLYEPVMPSSVAKKFDLKIQGEAIDFSVAPDWKKDYKTGKVFPELRFGRFNTNLFFDKGDDIKFPWDMSRCCFLPVQMAEMAANGETGAAYSFLKQTTESFIDNNRYLYGVNWVCTMEVAIRASNWLFAMPLVKSELQADRNFSNKLDYSLYRHAVYIDMFTEHKDNNHDISNYAGLILLGIYFNNKKWIKKAVDGLEYEMNKQILPDGCTYELSTYYNRLNLEFFATSLYAAKLHGITLSEAYVKRLEKMFAFLTDLTEANGYMPVINDNDGGRYVIFNDGNENDFSYINNLYNKLFEPQLKSGVQDVNALFLSLPEITRIKAVVPEKKAVSEYQNSKFYKLSNDVFTVVVSAAGLDAIHKQGHKHIDAGSVYIGINGKPAFIDPGTSSYTRSLKRRNQERSIGTHNTAVPTAKIDKYTCNGGYWGKLPGYPSIAVNDFSSSAMSLSMEFDGVSLARNIAVGNDRLEITDVSEGQDISAFFHTDIPFSQNGDTLVFNGFSLNSNGGQIKVEDFNYADNYGKLDNKAYKITIQGNSTIKTTITRS